VKPINPGHTVYVAQINAVIQVAERFGVDRTSLLHACQIDAEWLRHPEDRLPVKRFFDVYKLAVERSGRPDLGLYVGRVMYVDGTNLQLYMSTICSTFREYLNLVPSILKMQGDIGEVVIKPADEYIRLEWHPLQRGTAVERYLSDAILTSSMHIVNAICVDPISVKRACFSYPTPNDTQMLEQTFAAPLSFSAVVSCLYLDRAALDAPMIKLARERHGLHSGQLKDLFTDDNNRDPFKARVRQAMLRALPTDELSIDSLAKGMGVSRRTLQRRLTERGTHYMEVLAELRSDLSTRYLADERLGITEIAFMLGYSDQASFSTAFKSWHGMSPSDFRKQ
jgi:AraC-like DNA-binding protein